MQIRELNLTELETAYSVVCQSRKNLSYKEFEDLIYEMRHIEYKIFGIFERGALVNYAGVSISTSLAYKRHLIIYDMVTDLKFKKQGYVQMMYEYLKDYAKTCMCENLILMEDFQEKDTDMFHEKNYFEKKSNFYIKKIERFMR